MTGRQITLDPIADVPPIPFPRRRVESTLPCGFRIGWLEGSTEHDDRAWTFDLAAGAGCGSPWLSLNVRSVDGEFRYAEVVNMSDLVLTWLAAIFEPTELPPKPVAADDVCNACGAYVPGGADPSVMSQHDCDGEEQ